MSIEKIIRFDHVPAAPGELDAARSEWGTRAGFDIGKRVHPSHLSIILPFKGRLHQLASVWFENEPYTAQLCELEKLFAELQTVFCCWDSTRGELEALSEQGRLPGQMMGGGVVFTQESKQRLAGGLYMALEQGELVLLDDPRQEQSILQVNNSLKAGESEAGHGDAFWSNALALEAYRKLPFFRPTCWVPGEGG